MGPIRQKGVKKRRKLHGDQNGDASVPAAVSPASGSDEENSVDWFEEVANTIAGNLNLSPSKGLDMFQTIFNMSRGTFQYICSLARDHMLVKTHFAFISGAPMTVHDQVALALRRLSSGSSLIQIGDSFQVHHSTVSQVTWRFVEAMELYGRKHVRWPGNEERLALVKSRFEETYGLPNCCGAVEMSHVVMLVSTSETTADTWLDSSANHSMLVMGVVDSDMRFLDVVAGVPGKSSDYEALYNSSFYEKCQSGDRLDGQKIKLGETELPEYIVGNSGFPLLPWLMTPYQETELPGPKAEYNRTLKEARKVAQRAFHRLKDVWKMIDGKMWRPDKHKLPRFIFVCCILHNIVIDMEDEVLDTLTISRRHDPGYRMEPCGFVDDSAVASREMLSAYLYNRARH